MTEDELKKLEAIREAAPPGRWMLDDDGGEPPKLRYDDKKYHRAPDVISSDFGGNIFTNDSGVYSTLEACEFVVAAHEAFPKLIAEIRRLREFELAHEDGRRVRELLHNIPLPINHVADGEDFSTLNDWLTALRKAVE